MVRGHGLLRLPGQAVCSQFRAMLLVHSLDEETDLDTQNTTQACYLETQGLRASPSFLASQLQSLTV